MITLPDGEAGEPADCQRCIFFFVLQLPAAEVPSACECVSAHESSCIRR